MGSSPGNFEIVEVKDEPSTIRRPQTFRQIREQRPPTLKKVLNKSLEVDINKLFEAVNLRTSKSLDLSDSWRNASKKPMRAAGSLSPGIGFSEPVSLKQALRGLCISQAAEMAAVKRSSMTSASPRISEAGKITNLYRSVVSEASGWGCSPAEGQESTSGSFETLTHSRQDSFKNSANLSSVSSPSYSVKANVKIIECVSSKSGRPLAESSGYGVGISVNKLPRHLQDSEPKSPSQTAYSFPRAPAALLIKDSKSSQVHNDIGDASKVDKHLVEVVCTQDKKCDLVSHYNVSNPDKKTSGPKKDLASPSKVVNKAVPKVRRKAKLRTVSPSNAVKSNKDVKSTRSTSRAVKTVIRNKNLVIKKSKKVAVSVNGNSKTSNEVKSGLDHSSRQLICKRCQCSLKDTTKDSNENPPATIGGSGNCDANKSESNPTGWKNKGTPIVIVKTNITSKSTEKGDISESSKSSICDFSSSTTSLSVDSSLSGSTYGNRPHMSKDMRWGAISRVKKQYGFLELNHFNLLKKLGSGDIGTVYLAELIGTNCPFAIKVMDNEFLARRKKMPRAQTEREILRMLDHPFLPTLYAQFTSDNLACLVMEFCPGGDLHVLRQKQPGRYFPEQAARFYVAEVLLALEYLHMLGIVYRDLKPENILVREDGHIMLTDFDLSLRCSVNPTLIKSSNPAFDPPKVSGPCAGSNCIDPFCTGPSCKVSCFSPRLIPATARAPKVKANAAAQARSLPQLVVEPTDARSNSFVGTHEYLAPEIIKGEGHGSAVDWWTFGVLLYELLFGKTPFKGSTNEETLGNVVLQSLKFPDSPIVSFQARDLIRGLLVKEPENRLGTETGAAEIKRHPFFEGLNWALIRCAIPPQIPEFYDVGSSREKGGAFMGYGGNGEHLEFELF